MRQFSLLLLVIVINVIGQLSMKRGMTAVGAIPGDLSQLPYYALRTITTPFVLLGFTAYAVSSALWLVILSRVQLSLAYPVLSLGYALIVLVSAIFLKEDVTPIRWAGVAVICVGVYLISRS